MRLGLLQCVLKRRVAPLWVEYSLCLDDASAAPTRLLVARRRRLGTMFDIFGDDGELLGVVQGLPWPGAGRRTQLVDAGGTVLATFQRPKRAAARWRSVPRSVQVEFRDDTLRVRQRRPRKHDDGSFSLDFYGRVARQSCKNFQFELERGGRVALQHGRGAAGGNEFILDFALFTPLSAFALALTNAFA